MHFYNEKKAILCALEEMANYQRLEKALNCYALHNWNETIKKEASICNFLFMLILPAVKHCS